MVKTIINELEKKAAANPKKVVFPEATDSKILQAAKLALDNKIAEPILVGSVEEIITAAKEANVDISGMKLVSNENLELNSHYAEEFYKENQIFSIKKLNRVLKKPLYFAAMMVHKGDADAMVAGITNTTSDVILASQVIVGLQEKVSTVSSLFLMEIPHFNGPEGNLIVLSDGGVCQSPNPEELADIALTTADTTQALLGWEPRVAMLSYSTMGSAVSEDTKAVVEALNIAKKKNSQLKIDGEFQLDAAIVPEVAKKKVPQESEVAGNANILIVPDLNTGNILYKSIQRFANAKAYGPFLQGFKKTISDLSRGSSVDDIYGVTIMAVVRAQTLL
ncbi:phosphotransacetylase [Enterococcus raffinosus]|uniref:phosphate acyltransferase n=1 Tax=Enterococcus raffinosus TaxID=71452 RepID=UPI001C121B23|nr:phosphate acyltransferase [Enterococcus raffinosus]MBU5362551.1 phosphotransacetylase [Enterococcus raffinosus]